MTDRPRLRAAKPPFYRNIFVRHPVNPFLPLATPRVEYLRRLEPCVVMGRGHSGTRVVSWICHHLGIEMGADPAAVPSGDPKERSFKHHQRIVATHSLDVRSADAVNFLDLNRFQKAVYGFHRRLGVGAGAWGWKFPETYLIGPYVARTFPRARYIHLLRDGRDVAFKRHLTDVAEHRLARAILRRRDALTLPHHLQAAASWALQVERFDVFQRTLSPSSVLTLRYEELAQHPIDATERIAAFLGMRVTTAACQYAATEVTAEHAQQFRQQDPERVREIEQLIGPTLRAAGYAVRQEMGDPG